MMPFGGGMFGGRNDPFAQMDAMMDSMKSMMTSKEMRTMMENTMYVDAGGGEQEGEGPALAGNLQLAGPRSFGQTLKDLGGLLRMNL